MIGVDAFCVGFAVAVCAGSRVIVGVVLFRFNGRVIGVDAFCAGFAVAVCAGRPDTGRRPIGNFCRGWSFDVDLCFWDEYSCFLRGFVVAPTLI